MDNERVDIPISEDFLIRNLNGYDEYEASVREIMSNQNHVDIRTFALNAEENWTQGAIGPGKGSLNFNRLNISLVPGIIEVASSTPNRPVDILTGFSSTDFISMGLKEFSIEGINPTLSFIDFTSNAEGNFTEGPTISVPFSASENTLVTGSCEFRVQRALFESNPLVDLERITGVRFRISSSSTAKVVFLGLRLLDEKWQQGPLDYDNWNGRWSNTVPTNGNAETPPTFGQPILWRSDDPPGEDDPMPIDTQFGVYFYTGSQEHNNTFSLFLREVSKAFLTQLDLDGTAMSSLDGKPQPDLGVSEYGPRLMTDMDRFEMEQLDTMDMFDIERVPDPVFTGWIQFSLQWGHTNVLTVTNSSNPGYIFNNVPNLTSNTHYLLVCTLEGTQARAQIYEVNGTTFVINPSVVFDTTLISDDNLFKRRKGRVGWQAVFGDNDAYISHIRTRHATFAEYVSSPLSSLTPVKGAKLFVNYTQNTELWEGFDPGPENTKSGSSLTRDTARSTTGESYRIDNYGAANQGFESNVLNFTDFTQAEISFDLWYPSSLLQEAISKGETPGLTLQLKGLYENPTFSLVFPKIIPDQWQHVSGIDLVNYDLNQTGKYALLIVQPSASAGSWWIDNIKVFQRAIQWSARSVVSDPWESNYAPWTDFRDLVNSQNSGILFNVKGKDLQMRARALRQDANIVSAPKLVPTYAELGRLVWPENALKGLTPPTANFSTPTPVTTISALPFLDSGEHSEPENYYETGNWRKFPWAAAGVKAKKGEGLVLGSFGEELRGSYYNIEFSGTNQGISVERLKGTHKNSAERFWELWLCLKGHSGYRAKFTNTSETQYSVQIYKVTEGTEVLLKEATGLTISEIEQFGFVKEGSTLTTYANSSGTWVSLTSTTDSTFTKGFIGFGGEGNFPRYINLFGGEVQPSALEKLYSFISSSTPGSGGIVLYEWTFGDGERATGANVTHSYLKHGTYQVTLTVTDRYGQQNNLTSPLVV